MDWTQIFTVFTIIITNLTTVIILYCHTDTKMEEHRRENNSKMEEHRRETSEILKGIREDIRDFHGKLCAIEERNKEKK